MAEPLTAEQIAALRCLEADADSDWTGKSAIATRHNLDFAIALRNAAPALLAAAEKQVPVKPVKPVSEWNYLCGKCSGPVKERHAFCPNCGHPIQWKD